jgi:molybdopterin/thiamine biosynthesis adenylyltransferase
MVYVIGAGGVGSWLIPALAKLVGKSNVTAVDGDILEQKNLDRQLFSPDFIGINKARALAILYETHAFCEYYSAGRIELFPTDWLICAADNHPARAAVLSSCDSIGCQSITGANETHSAEAFYYRREWRGSGLDPRVYYPEIGSNTAGDPLAASSGCTGEAQTENPQLVSANLLAAGLALQLFALWSIVAKTLDDVEHLPFILNANMTKLHSTKVKDALWKLQQKPKE